MRERRKLADLSLVATVQELQRLSAQRSLAEAIGAEERCNAEVDQAERDVREALSYWRDRPAPIRLDPVLHGAFAQELETRDTELLTAQQAHDKAKTQTAERQTQHAICDVRSVRTSALIRRLRRRLGRRATEKAMSAIEERTTFQCVAR